MAKVYVRVNVGIMEDTRYAALSWSGKAAWHTLNMAQGAQPQERFRSVPEHPIVILRREGCPDPEGAVAELVALGWFDQDHLGWSIHNWTVYQVPSRAQELREKRAKEKERSGSFANVQSGKGEGEGEGVNSRTNDDEEDGFERPVLAGGKRVGVGAYEFFGPHADCRMEGVHVHVQR